MPHGEPMAKELSKTQKIFLAKILENKSVPRTSLNPTGKSLSKLGLVKYVLMWGWCLTDVGIQEAKKHVELLDEYS